MDTDSEGPAGPWGPASLGGGQGDWGAGPSQGEMRGLEERQETPPPGTHTTPWPPVTSEANDQSCEHTLPS